MGHLHKSTGTHGPWLIWAARLLWLAVLCLVAAICIEMIPHNLQETRYEWVVQEAMDAVAPWMAFSRYVRLIVAVEYLVIAIYWGAALLIFIKGHAEPFIIFVSATLLLLSLNFGLSGNMDALRLPATIAQRLPGLETTLPALILIPFALLYLLLPDGRFRPGWMRWIAIPSLTGLLLTSLLLFHDVIPEWLAIILPVPGVDGVWLLLLCLILVPLIGVPLLLLARRGAPRAAAAPERSDAIWLWSTLGIALITLGALTLAWLADADDELGWMVFVWTICTPMQLGLLSQLYRYWAERDPVQRQQVKWLAWGLAAPIFGLLIGILLQAVLATGAAYLALENLYFPLLTTLIPLSILFSILRLRLWGIDALLSRTLVYGTLTIGTILLYVLLVGISASMVRTDEPGRVSWLAVLIVAACCPHLLRGLNGLAHRLAPQWSRTNAQHVTEESACGSAHLTRLPPRWRLPALVIWLGLVGTALLFMLVNLPYRYRQLSTICPAVECYGGRLHVYQALLLSESGITLGQYAGYMTALTLLVALVAFGLAALVLWRRADDWMALLIALTVVCALAAQFESGETALPSWRIVHLSMTFFFFIGISAVLFLFPDGHFETRWTRRLFEVWVAFVAAFSLRLALPQQLFAGDFWYQNDGAIWGALLAMNVIVFGAGVYSQVVRYRLTHDARLQQQTKWAVVGLCSAMVIYLTNLLLLNAVASLTQQGWPGGGLFELSQATMFALLTVIIPTGFAIAMLGYRLWDVDVILRRTLVYGTLTILIALFYIVLVGVLSTVLRSSTGLAVSIAATGCIALLFQPLRQGMQRLVNRLIYGERDDPATVLTRLGRRLEGTVAPYAVPATIVETVTQALKLPYAELTLGGEGEAPPLAAHGMRQETVHRFPIIYQGVPMGQLAVAARAPGETLTAADLRLLRDIAQQAGPALRALHLTEELQRSRVQLVVTREEERRRLRRDLHDGLGPQLASLAMKIDAARSRLHDDPAAAEQLLVQYKQESQEALADLRRLVYGLRPPVLDQLGLVSALRAFAANHSELGDVAVSIEVAQELPLLSAAVEVAAYRIALEALTNVAHHAGAKRCRVELWARDAFYMTIADDGMGIDAQAPNGVGLHSMYERAQELGGLCEITARLDGGTQVMVRLPLAPALDESTELARG